MCPGPRWGWWLGRGAVAAMVVMMQASRANAWSEIETARTLDSHRTEEAASSRVAGSWVVSKADTDPAPRRHHSDVCFGFL